LVHSNHELNVIDRDSAGAGASGSIGNGLVTPYKSGKNDDGKKHSREKHDNYGLTVKVQVFLLLFFAPDIENAGTPGVSLNKSKLVA
jgi:hypothetical protein